MVMIKLSSSDERVFVVPREVAIMSTAVSNLFTDLGFDDISEEDAEKMEPIPLQNVDGNMLEKVLLWCTHHKGEPASEEPTTDDFSDFDEDYFRLEVLEILEIIKAANYLDIKGLLDLACRRVANMLKGKSVEEIRQMCALQNDFTPEEENAIRKESAWCEA